jgi:hypothetical protein
MAEKNFNYSPHLELSAESLVAYQGVMTVLLTCEPFLSVFLSISAISSSRSLFVLDLSSALLHSLLLLCLFFFIFWHVIFVGTVFSAAGKKTLSVDAWNCDARYH